MFNFAREVSRRRLSWPRIVRASFHHHHQHDEMMPCLLQELFFFWQKGRASFQLFKKGRASPKEAGRRALQKRPRQKTVVVEEPLLSLLVLSGHRLLLATG